MSIAVQPPIVRMLQPRAYSSKREVIEAIGDVMVDVAAVTPAYVEGMLRKEQEGSTIVTPGVALPHGTADVRDAVRRNVLVVAAIPGAIEWRPGQRVSLAIGFAGTGDEAHLRLLGSVARVLADEELLNQLKNANELSRLESLFEMSGGSAGRPPTRASGDIPPEKQ
jgi:mannitol/fructose-specific phosphotransferase system IIA component